MSAVTFQIVRDTATGKILQALRLAKNPAPVLRAMGTTFMSLTLGTFNDVGAGYRPIPWAPKKDGSPSKLQKSGTLARSFHLTVTPQAATVATPVVYAATHQFGRDFGRGSPIPARPFFPVAGGQFTEKAAAKIAAVGQRALNRETGAA